MSAHSLTHALGVGVGDATASPTAALLLSVVQESLGRLATILFAHKLGNSLVAECKRYRLLADIFNDAAFILDCLSPMFPKPVRVAFLSVSSVFRAICGVAAGSSKTSLSAHFAKWGNLGELNAVGHNSKELPDGQDRYSKPIARAVFPLLANLMDRRTLARRQ